MKTYGTHAVLWGLAILLCGPVLHAEAPKVKDKSTKASIEARKKAAVVKVGGKECFDEAAAQKRSKEGMHRQYEARFFGAAMLVADLARVAVVNYWGNRLNTWVDQLRSKHMSSLKASRDGNANIVGLVGWAELAGICRAVSARNPTLCDAMKDGTYGEGLAERGCENCVDKCRLMSAVYRGKISKCGDARSYAGACRAILTGPDAPCEGTKEACANLARSRKGGAAFCKGAGGKAIDVRCMGHAVVRAKITGKEAECETVTGPPHLKQGCYAMVRGDTKGCEKIVAKLTGKSSRKGLVWHSAGMVAEAKDGIRPFLWVTTSQPALCQVRVEAQGKDGKSLFKQKAFVRVPDAPDRSDTVLPLDVIKDADPFVVKVSTTVEHCTPRYWW